MKISAIKPAVKTKGRFNLFVDGKYSFSLGEQQVLDEGIMLDQDIDEPRLEALKRASDFGKKYARALELIVRRARSVKEIHDYGWRKKWTPEETQQIVEKLQAKGYLDDEKFALVWIRSRALLKNISRRKLQLELRQKGIQAEIIEQVINASEDYDERQALRDLIAKKQGRYADPQKFMAFLLRQGFSYGDVKQVMEEAASS